jgi:uncharacterized GH25 family protein
VLCLPLSAQAHRAWILPAATVLSSDDAWVTFDAAVSNDIFHIDYNPLRLGSLQVFDPENQPMEAQNAHTGKYRAVFDLNLKSRGTYKVAIASHGLSARWENEEGQRRFWPARGTTPKPGDFEREVPKAAKNLQVSESSRRIETFVTAGEPSEAVLAPTKVGLELLPVTHPNDLFAGETAEFRFLIDGEAAVGAEVEIVPAGRRYRNDEAAIELTTDENGAIHVEWPHAGMYWLSVSYRDDRAKAPATMRNGSYTGVFEVLPE